MVPKGMMMAGTATAQTLTQVNAMTGEGLAMHHMSQEKALDQRIVVAPELFLGILRENMTLWIMNVKGVGAAMMLNRTLRQTSVLGDMLLKDRKSRTSLTSVLEVTIVKDHGIIATAKGTVTIEITSLDQETIQTLQIIARTI
jgi:hypothetical protein